MSAAHTAAVPDRNHSIVGFAKSLSAGRRCEDIYPIHQRLKRFDELHPLGECTDVSIEAVGYSGDVVTEEFWVASEGGAMVGLH